MSEVKTLKVNELANKKFFIPSYQRGYRWNEVQINDLLNDIDNFNPENNSWYCLQPLAVRKMEGDDSRLKEKDKRDWYEVIDGQQRLTTIYIILKLLDLRDSQNTPFVIQYESRQKSKSFLERICESSVARTAEDDNIDYYFMDIAKTTIDIWKAGKSEECLSLFVRKLSENCRVIWYEAQEESAYEVFKRLNSGKISLSNAELVKALVLNIDNFSGVEGIERQLRQSERADEWNRIEQMLHEDSFWYFINPEPEDPRYDATRMDFLLEIILRCEKDASGEKKYDVDKELSMNNYFVFSEFVKKFKTRQGQKDEWGKIQHYYRIMKGWYDNRQLYHYVGYLMNQKGKNKEDTLCDLLANGEKRGKKEFLLYLKFKCAETLFGDKGKTVQFQDLEYGKNNDTIHNILLLFNLATTQNQISEVSRYPFERHFQAAKKKWSLEHIHAQNEKKISWDEEQFKCIKDYLRKLHREDVDKIVEFLDRNEIHDGGGLNDKLYKVIMGAFMGFEVKEDKSDVDAPFISDFEKDDRLTNMALLQGDKNAAFNNKTYPEKREILAKYENAENVTAFVPVCTRNAFFKHYAPTSDAPYVWDRQAGREYVNAIVKCIASYLGVKPHFQDAGNGDMAGCEYGLERVWTAFVN